MTHLLRLCSLIAAALVPLAVHSAQTDKPAALVADGVPPVPQDLAVQTRPYMEFRTARFSGWNAADRSMLIATRFANTAQLHRVKQPMGARAADQFRGGAHGRASGRRRVTSWWRARMPAATSSSSCTRWPRDASRCSRMARVATNSTRGRMTASSSATARPVAMAPTRSVRVDPRDPAPTAARAGEGRRVGRSTDFAPDARRGGPRSTCRSPSRICTGRCCDRRADADRRSAQDTSPMANAMFAPDGTLWVTWTKARNSSGLERSIRRPVRFMRARPRHNGTSRISRLPTTEPYRLRLNEAGITRLKVIDTNSGAVRTVTDCPKGLSGEHRRSRRGGTSACPSHLRRARWTPTR